MTIAFSDGTSREQRVAASETGDKGQTLESDAGLLATLKRWGDKCVNPEYERVRPQYEARKKARQVEAKPREKAGSKKKAKKPE